MVGKLVGKHRAIAEEAATMTPLLVIVSLSQSFLAGFLLFLQQEAGSHHYWALFD